MSIHHLDDSEPHAFWDNSHPPRVRIEPGDAVVFETVEGTGQVAPESGHETLASLEPTLIHPLTGPGELGPRHPGASTPGRRAQTAGTWTSAT